VITKQSYLKGKRFCKKKLDIVFVRPVFNGTSKREKKIFLNKKCMNSDNKAKLFEGQINFEITIIIIKKKRGQKSSNHQIVK